MILAVDPGYRESACVVYDGKAVLAHSIETNEALLYYLQTFPHDAVLVLEEMQVFRSNYGIGKEVFDSVFWSGRFVQAWHPKPYGRIIRAKVRGHLGAMKGGDAAVRQALIARFGPYKEDAIGKKSNPGPLFGLKSHEWSALAIAVAWWDLDVAANAVGF